MESHLLDDLAVPLLSSLGRRSENPADLGPGDPGRPSGHHGLDDQALTTGTVKGGTLQRVLLDRAFVCGVGVVLLETPGQLVGVVEDVLDGSGHDGHLRNFDLAGMA